MEFDILALIKPVKMNKDDFLGDDGRICCGVCGQPKEYVHKINGREIRHSCACKCVIDAYEQEIRKAKEQDLERKRMETFGGGRYLNMTFENAIQTQPLRYARNFVKEFKKVLELNKGLLFRGDTGTGKTYLCACIVNALIMRGYKCVFTTFPNIVNNCWNNQHRNEYIEKLLSCDLLVVDDLGDERKTELATDVVREVIEKRYEQGLPIVVATNLSQEELFCTQDRNRVDTYDKLKYMTQKIETKEQLRKLEYQKSANEFSMLLKGEK